MAYTLNNALLAVSRYMLPKHSGAATGGSQTTLVDATRKQANDQFNNGVIFFITGSFAGQYATVTDYASSTGTFTFASIGAPGIVAGVQYEAFALMSGLNLYDIIGAINQALDTVGDVLQEDDSSLTSVDGQETYTLPTGVYNLTKLEFSLDTSAPYMWRPHHHWDELNGELRIPNQYAYRGDGYLMRLTYKAPHDTLADYDDEVSHQVNTEWLKFAASINLMQSLANRGANWKDMKTLFEKAEERVTSMRPLKRGVSVMVKTA